MYIYIYIYVFFFMVVFVSSWIFMHLVGANSSFRISYSGVICSSSRPVKQSKKISGYLFLGKLPVKVVGYLLWPSTPPLGFCRRWWVHLQDTPNGVAVCYWNLIKLCCFVGWIETIMFYSRFVCIHIDIYIYMYICMHSVYTVSLVYLCLC